MLRHSRGRRVRVGALLHDTAPRPAFFARSSLHCRFDDLANLLVNACWWVPERPRGSRARTTDGTTGTTGTNVLLLAKLPQVAE